VHVELEEVEEGVADHGDGTVELRLDAVVELQWLARLIAYRKRDPLNLVCRILDVFASLSVFWRLAGFATSASFATSRI
jgi:hypothetical protein